MGPFLTIGQFFGVLPLVGTTCRSISHMKFKWNALTTFYSLFIITILTCYSSLLIWQKMQQKNNYSSIGELAFIEWKKLNYNQTESIYLSGFIILSINEH